MQSSMAPFVLSVMCADRQHQLAMLLLHPCLMGVPADALL